MKTKDNKLGNYLRASRMALGLGLRETARATGVSAAYLSGLERGLMVAGIPSLTRLAKFLRLDRPTLARLAGRLVNARAATDLLYALEAVVAYWDSDSEGLVGPDVIDAAREAIAKARGE